MRSQPSDRRSRALSLLGIYETVGGLVGIGLMGWLSVRHPEALPWGNLLIAASPFGLVLTAGLRLRQRYAGGWPLSLLAQLIQVCSWSGRRIVWKFCAGGYLYAVLTSKRPTLSAGVDATLLVGTRITDHVPTVGLNLVPVAVILFLFSCRRSARVSKLLDHSISTDRAQ